MYKIPTNLLNDVKYIILNSKQEVATSQAIMNLLKALNSLELVETENTEKDG